MYSNIIKIPNESTVAWVHKHLDIALKKHKNNPVSLSKSLQAIGYQLLGEHHKATELKLGELLAENSFFRKRAKSQNCYR